MDPIGVMRDLELTQRDWDELRSYIMLYGDLLNSVQHYRARIPAMKRYLAAIK
jgi:hypothetical protein